MKKYTVCLTRTVNTYCIVEAENEDGIMNAIKNKRYKVYEEIADEQTMEVFLRVEEKVNQWNTVSWHQIN